MDKRLKLILLLSIFMTSYLSTYAQIPYQLFQLTSFSGQVRVRGTYQDLMMGQSSLYNGQSQAFLDGYLMFRSKSFILHPNFCELSLNGTWNPQGNSNYYVGVPYTEKTTTQGLDASAVFFKKYGMNLMLTGNINNGFSNIENITQVKTDAKSFGATFISRITYFPFTVSYNKQYSDQNTIGNTPDLSRDLVTKLTILQGNSSKSFTPFDNTNVSFVQTQTTSIQAGPTLLLPESYNYMIYLSTFNNTLFFTRSKKYLLSSTLTNTDETGSLVYKQLYGVENLTLNLPYKVKSFSSYNYSIMQQDTLKMYTQSFQTTLSKQLYNSLNVQLGYSQRRVLEVGYDEYSHHYNFDLNYNKNIPTGTLNIAFNLNKDYQQVTTPTTELSIVHEQYSLADNVITLLKHPDVENNTVVVRDVTGAILYQQGLDYVLIQQGAYTEIMRIPGGLIPNNANVYIDYKALTLGLYHYDGLGNGAAVSATFLHGLLNPYVRYTNQNYSNTTPTESVVLNFFTREIAGFRVNYHQYKLGVEYENYQSNIIPYQSIKYFLNYQKMYGKLFLNGSFNLMQIRMIQEALNRQYADAAIKVGYLLMANLKMNLEYQLRNVSSVGMNINSNVLKIDFTTTLHLLNLTCGANIYSTNSNSYITDYKGIYVTMTRTF